MRKKTDAYLEQKQEELLKDIRELVRIPSLHGDVQNCTAALEYVRRRAQDFGLKTSMTAEKDVCVIELGDGPGTVGVLTHVDVVGIGDPQKWTYPPLDMTIDKGAIWGRGTADDKGPVMISLYVLRAIKELGIPLKKKICLIVGSCEEGIWTDMEHFKEQFPAPDHGFTPDGAFPIYNVEKGYADICLTFSEPEGCRITRLLAGDSRNTIPPRAVIQLKGGEEIAYDGISAHSSAPESADNAIIKMCKDREKLYPFNFMKFIDRFLSDCHVPQLKLDDGTEFYNGEYAGKTTAAPTVISAENGVVTVNVNIRHRFGNTGESILARFREHEREYNFKARLIECQDPIMVSEKLPSLRLMQQVYESYGHKSEFCLAPGCTYAKALENFVCWGPFFPDDVDRVHMEDECLSIKTIMEAAKIYAAYLVLDGSESGPERPEQAES